MFYQKLLSLKKYNIPETIIQRLKDNINELPTDRVSPLLIAERLDIDANQAFTLCLSLVKEKLASIQYEITCPACSSDVIIVDNLRRLPKKEIKCDICDKSFEPTLDDIWIVFNFLHKSSQIQPKDTGMSDGITITKAFENSLFNEITKNELFQIDREKLRNLLFNTESARTNDEKKKTLEELASYLFSSIYGIEIADKNMRARTSEIDLLLEKTNNIIDSHPLFKQFSYYIVVECKNWESPVGSDEIRDIEGVLRSRNINCCFFISKKGFTKDASSEISRIFANDKIMIFSITIEDIRDILEGKNIIDILRDKYKDIIKAI